MERGAVAGVVAVLAIVLVGGSPAAQAAVRGASLCTGYVDPQGSSTETCFPPRKVGQIERRLRVSPLRPSAVVWHMARLQLNQVGLISAMYGSGSIGSPIGIEYVFGQIPAGPRGFPNLVGQRSHYVIITEGVSRAPSSSQGLSPDDYGHARYWIFHSNFRCRDTGLIVTSNEPPRVVKRIGLDILAADRCGK